MIGPAPQKCCNAEDGRSCGEVTSTHLFVLGWALEGIMLEAGSCWRLNGHGYMSQRLVRKLSKTSQQHKQQKPCGSVAEATLTLEAWCWAVAYKVASKTASQHTSSNSKLYRSCNIHPTYVGSTCSKLRAGGSWQELCRSNAQAKECRWHFLLQVNEMVHI